MKYGLFLIAVLAVATAAEARATGKLEEMQDLRSLLQELLDVRGQESGDGSGGSPAMQDYNFLAKSCKCYEDQAQEIPFFEDACHHVAAVGEIKDKLALKDIFEHYGGEDDEFLNLAHCAAEHAATILPSGCAVGQPSGEGSNLDCVAIFEADPEKVMERTYFYFDSISAQIALEIIREVVNHFGDKK